MDIQYYRETAAASCILVLISSTMIYFMEVCHPKNENRVQSSFRKLPKSESQLAYTCWDVSHGTYHHKIHHIVDVDDSVDKFSFTS